MLRGVAIIANANALLPHVEGESPPHNRLERWGRVIGRAGQRSLSIEEFELLQDEVIPDQRFITPGLRNEGGFIGVHDRMTGMPLPDHISAKPQDLDSEDGNGRIHRYLIHHVLAETGFVPKGLVFPVSAVILERIDAYKKTLEHFSKRRLVLIDWRPTVKNNIEVLNDTRNLYRFFDATKQAEFLFECVAETVNVTLPAEVDYLLKYDQLNSFIKNFLDMPDNKVDLLIRLLVQHGGRLSKRAIGKEFSGLTEQERQAIEVRYLEVFSG